MRWVKRVGRTRWFGVVVGVAAFVIMALVGWWGGVPNLYIQDEGSYLLAADTFAHGRLTNPSHPLWRHFETFHVLQQPTYMSKYQPGQGLVLALGQVLIGKPIVGAWAAAALATGALAWALRQWVPPGWAVLGAVMWLAHPLSMLRWGQSYWGGHVAMFGGALVTGATAGLWKRPGRLRDALILAAGLVVLGLSRPYEGGVFAAMVAGALCLGYWRTDRFQDVKWGRMLAVVGPVILAGVGFQAYYNWRAAGTPWVLPYMEYERHYNPVPLFVWQSRREVGKWQAPTMAEEYRRDLEEFEGRRFLRDAGRKVVGLGSEYVGRVAPAAGVALIGVLVARGWRRRRVLVAAGIVAGMTGVVLLNTVTMAHYIAPAVACLGCLVTEGLRGWGTVRVGRRRVGRWIVAGIVGVQAVLFGVRAYQWPERLASYWTNQRVAVADAVESSGGPGDRHVVLVRYDPSYHGLMWREWVINRADIDAQRVVWAHDRGAEGNRDLVEYYKGRRIWLLTVGEGEKKLEPYRGS